MLDKEIRRTWFILRRSGFSAKQAGGVIRIAAIEEAVNARRKALQWMVVTEERMARREPAHVEADCQNRQLEIEWHAFCLSILLPRDSSV